MRYYEKQNVLASMVILVDTREQRTGRAERRYKAFTVPYRRQKLDYGDYSAEATAPDGTQIRVNAAVERKMNLEELSGCLTHGRERFKAEFERAKAAGASMYLLLENTTWEDLICGKYNTKFSSKAFLASLSAWIVRYDIKVIMCRPETSGLIIQELLYRELKERLERGEYG